jgi:cation diffusion facilitator CzcD-associated flavoprotein CzcO
MNEHVDIAIIGSGFAGIGAAIRLQQAGFDDYVVLERADDVGGTWRDNSYPGCACDVPSHLYSFSFAPNPAWTRSFSPQPEIWTYLRRVADEHGVTAKTRFGAEVLDAAWMEDRGLWEIETAAGDITARVLIAGFGGLAEPKLPDVPGIADFPGTVFHSARWNHEHDLTGERVAVIGTGASAIQFVPQIQPKVSALHLFQRTAPWVMPRVDREFTRAEKLLFKRLPFTQRLARAAIYWSREAMVIGMAGEPRLLKGLQLLAKRFIRRSIKDPALRDKVTPSYTIGCKRILISSDYLPSLDQPNIELITSGLSEVRGNVVVGADGTECEVDTIIFGTGFHVTDSPMAQRVRGADGRSLAEHWEGSMQAHRGTTVAGFPNYFHLVGPNTGLGHNSIVYMIESQLNYVVDALATLRREGAHSCVVDRGAQARYNERVQRAMQGTVWTGGGCASWYIDRHGRNTTLWPGFTFKFRELTKAFDREHYELRPAPVREIEEVAA